MAKQATTQEPPVLDAPEQASTTPRWRGPSANRVILVGRLCADPELKYTASGFAVATIRLATNDREEPQYHDVVVWRKLAETAAKYLAKGRTIYLEGYLHANTWEGQDGAKHRRVEVVAENVQFLSSRPAEAQES